MLSVPVLCSRSCTLRETTVLKESETMELESLSISLCQPLSAGDQDRRSDRHVAQLALSGQEGPKVAPKRKHTKPQNGIATKTKTQRNPTNIEMMIATPSQSATLCLSLSYYLLSSPFSASLFRTVRCCLSFFILPRVFVFCHTLCLCSYSSLCLCLCLCRC